MKMMMENNPLDLNTSKKRSKRIVQQKQNLIQLNAPQYTAIYQAGKKVHNPKNGLLEFIKTIVLEWARGTGKSTILGWFIKEAVIQMPRATGIIVGETYLQILSRTLPSTKEGLEMFGLFEDVDYVVGRSGKSYGFDMPFQAPSKNWDNVIHFSNGFIMILVSNDMPSSGRGINSSFVIGDEAVLLDKERLFNNVQTTNRSTCGGLYADKPLCNAEIYASSVAMSKKGQWFTDMEALAKREPWKVLFIKANAFANKYNLAADWFERMRDNAPSQVHYDAEILNIRPKKVANGFYPSLDPKLHYYRDAYDYEYLQKVGVHATKKDFNCKQDTDFMKSKPLIMSIDWGNIITMKIAQDQGDRYRVLKTFFVTSPEIIDDIIEKHFSPYYEDKKKSNNVIEFYFDRNGNNNTPNSRVTFAEQAIECMNRAGWKVKVKVRKGSENPPHNEKFIVVNYLLKHGGSNGLPMIEINESNCGDMIVSLENAPAMEGNRPNTIIKDKRSEKSKTLPQEHATHFSDTFDIPLYWKYHKQVMRLIQQKDERAFMPLFKGHAMS
jgi:hypothetical protein